MTATDQLITEARELAAHYADRPQYRDTYEAFVALADRLAALSAIEQAAERVYETVPAEFEGPAADRHARALNELRVALAARKDAE